MSYKINVANSFFTILCVVLVPKLKNLDSPVDDKKENEDIKDDVDMQVLSKHIEDEQLTLKALDGFLLVLSDDGDITFVSENIGDILGLSKVRLTHHPLFPERDSNKLSMLFQIDMMGQPIWDYAHACDHEELRETLNGRKTSPSELLSGLKTCG